MRFIGIVLGIEVYFVHKQFETDDNVEDFAVF